MRSLGSMLAAAALAATLAGCGNSTPAGGSASPPAAPPPTEAEMKAAQPALPAPYNTADLANGASKFALCASCHTLAEGGPSMTGPNLHGVFGRKAASLETFHYSDALKAKGWTWDAQHLDTWITDPTTDVPGNKMTFVGLSDAKDRTDVIAYVMLQTGYKP